MIFISQDLKAALEKETIKAVSAAIAEVVKLDKFETPVAIVILRK
jgi:hypothetical protein